VRGRLGHSERAHGANRASACVNGEATGRMVVGGERAGEGMGGTRDLTSGLGLLVGERREREGEGAADGWGRAVRSGRAQLGRLGRGRRGGEMRARARLGPETAQSRGGENVFPFSFSVFYFSFLFSISIFFLSPFPLNNNLLTNLRC
jgi:hypothetical protein